MKNRPCRHEPLSPNTCRMCWLALNNPKYAKWAMPIVDGNDSKKLQSNDTKSVVDRLKCVYLGGKIDGQPCGTPLRNCNFDGTVCSTYKPCTGALRCCQTCPHFQKADDVEKPVAKNHVLMHLMPLRWNGAWQRNLDQLFMRLHHFDGKKVIAVVTRTGTTTQDLDEPDVVREYVQGKGFTIIEVPNDPSLREVATWPKLWEQVEEFKTTEDRVFYCHGKAVTRFWNPGVTCHPWGRLMWSGNLDFMSLTYQSLRRFPITGVFKKVGQGFSGSRSSWHYSGSFFWINCQEMFKNDRWRHIDRQWWGNESWPGIHFPPDHAGCLFHEGQVPALNLYSWDYLTKRVVPEFQTWCSQNRNVPSVIG